MGHREDLLAGAKRCLLEKGWSRTTARDIVAASGANLASIGYHYGSKDALMREALFASMGDWGDDVEAALQDRVSPSATLLERFGAGWDRILELFARHQGLWRAQIEAALQAQHDPELREAFAQAQPEGRKGLVALFAGVDEEQVDEETAKVLGSLYMTLVSGLAVQMTLNSGLTPESADLMAAIQRIATGDHPERS
ncbi:TetR/AcrR family transcriptional regulator [Streptomyces palmae]|uniref:TetR/AcrR family transcriptional regulator n=1 Tax=Streptomyces palmae TaxID=1701085 RepID=A0A4Z0H5R3_9ACTN|nr:TetR/AcrR family transcriptional regulator [Streptomyces palmae]TGB07142.1 TetR/AcrR family transcriptional regulator [Streptomyces palmae]